MAAGIYFSQDNITLEDLARPAPPSRGWESRDADEQSAGWMSARCGGRFLQVSSKARVVVSRARLDLPEGKAL